MRDSQRTKVYRWEQPWIQYTGQMTLDEVKALAVEAYHFFGLSTHYLVVKDGRGRTRAGGRSNLLTMPRWSRTHEVTLHEAAHGICQRLYGYSWAKTAGEHRALPAAHGPEFVAIYMTLLHHFTDHRFDVTAPLAIEGKVRYVDPVLFRREMKRQGRVLDEKGNVTPLGKVLSEFEHHRPPKAWRAKP